jgi:sterol desaturase/sphingolipid hydroxylase (fatty acid hydroxylase superfamily)
VFAIDPSTEHVIDWLTRLAGAVAGAAQERAADMTAPIYIGAVLCILALERLIPARPNQPIFSAAFFQDVVWAFIEAVGQATVSLAWVLLLRAFYERYLDFLTLDIEMRLPSWLVILLALVCMDFLRWLQHVIQHKVPWFWHFHVVHHSQTNLNLFSDYRYHVVEYMVRQTVYFIPLLMLGMQQQEIYWIALVLVWQARLYHGNIRTNFGPLRYLIVTPQSHRIHHSLEARHQDRNFGAFFSIWDWLFGTQYRGHTEYPDTGVADPTFPLERSAGPFSLLLTPVRQMIYPFRAIGRSLGGQRGGRGRQPQPRVSDG